jgi:hypothetical protein
MGAVTTRRTPNHGGFAVLQREDQGVRQRSPGTILLGHYGSVSQIAALKNRPRQRKLGGIRGLEGINITVQAKQLGNSSAPRRGQPAAAGSNIRVLLAYLVQPDR